MKCPQNGKMIRKQIEARNDAVRNGIIFFELSWAKGVAVLNEMPLYNNKSDI